MIHSEYYNVFDHGINTIVFVTIVIRIAFRNLDSFFST